VATALANRGGQLLGAAAGMKAAGKVLKGGGALLGKTRLGQYGAQYLANSPRLVGGLIQTGRGVTAAGAVGLSTLGGWQLGSSFEQFSQGNIYEGTDQVLGSGFSFLGAGMAAKAYNELTKLAGEWATTEATSPGPNGLAEHGGSQNVPPSRHVRNVDVVGDPKDYVRTDYEQMVVQNKAGRLALFKGSPEFPTNIRPVPDSEVVFHTHPTLPIPSPSPCGRTTRTSSLIFSLRSDHANIFTHQHLRF